MKYFEVELTNPDEFLKQQTEDFVKANRLLLRKIIQSVTVYEEHFVISVK
ncbi:DNA recombinase, partial [Streptococcus suis]|nr:DNA recombinase [Streptococcus suis]